MGTLRGSPSNYSEHAWIRLHDDMTIQATDQGDKDRWSAVVIQAAMNNINEWPVRDSSCMFVGHGESWIMHDTEKSLWSAFRCQRYIEAKHVPEYWNGIESRQQLHGWTSFLLKGMMRHLVLRDHVCSLNHNPQPLVQSYPSTTFKTP